MADLKTSPDELWAVFYGAPPAHRFRKAVAGDCYRSLCGKVSASRAQLKEAAAGRRCKRCDHILERSQVSSAA
jgi:hypothetical protein